MIVKTPTLDELSYIAADFGLDFSDADLTSLQALMRGTLASHQRLQELVEPTLPVKYPRTPGYRPNAAEDPLNAWAHKCSIKGAKRGPLSGKRIAIKDNICIENEEITCASKILRLLMTNLYSGRSKPRSTSVAISKSSTSQSVE